jgi:hypothetical protein
VTTLETVGALKYDGGDVTLNQVINKADIDLGKLTFDPLANENGAGYDSFEFKVHDGTEYSAAAYTMTVDVTAVNDAPTASNNTVTTNEDTTYTFVAGDFNFSDIDGDTLSQIQVTALETVGALRYDGTDVTLNQVINKADIDLGKLTYDPVANQNGNGYDTFGFKVHDGTEYSASAYTMTIDVTAINDAPAGADNTVTILEDTGYTFAAVDFGFSDPDVPADTLLAVKITTLPGAGSLTNDGAAVSAGDSIAAADITAGKLKFTPMVDENGEGYASFTFQVQDDGGTAAGGKDLDQTPNTMTIDVTGVNDAPTFIALDNTIVNENDTGAVIGTLTTTDADPGDSHTYTVDDPRFEVTAGQLKLKAGHSLDYEAEPSVNVTVTSTDAGGLSTARTFALAVGNVNETPIAVDDNLSVNQDQSFTITPVTSLLGNDTDIDGDTLTISGFTQPASGMLVDHGDGTLTYTPSADFSGIDSFTYIISDNKGGTATGTAIVVVAPVEGNPFDNLPSPPYAVERDSSKKDPEPFAEKKTEKEETEASEEDPDKVEPLTEISEDVDEETEASESDADETVVEDVIADTGKSETSPIAKVSATPEPVPNTSESIFKKSDSDRGIEGNRDGAPESNAEPPAHTVTARVEHENLLVPEADPDKPEIPTLSPHAYAQVRKSLDAVKNEVSGEIRVGKTVLGATVATSVSLSAGYVIWMLKGGSLLASVLSSLPAWRLTDPLAILMGRTGDEDDDESLETIIDKGSGRDEGAKSNASDEEEQ